MSCMTSDWGGLTCSGGGVGADVRRPLVTGGIGTRRLFAILALTILERVDHFSRGMQGETALVIERAQLSPLDRGLLASESRNNAVIAPDDKWKIVDDVVDRDQRGAGWLKQPHRHALHGSNP